MRIAHARQRRALIMLPGSRSASVRPRPKRALIMSPGSRSGSVRHKTRRALAVGRYGRYGHFKKLRGVHPRPERP